MRLAQEAPSHPFLQNCFGPDVVLVPVPGSSLLVLGGLWPADRLCKAIRNEGLAANVRPLLTRTKAVPKSATAGPGQRPSVETHYDSLAIRPATPLLPPTVRFTIVDDVVTRGATLLASYVRLREAYPDVPINCFALIRTMSGVEVDSVLNPVEGVISLAGGHLHRNP
jgi:predicted amidophosphoribosyltransferase